MDSLAFLVGIDSVWVLGMPKKNTRILYMFGDLKLNLHMFQWFERFSGIGMQDIGKIKFDLQV